MNKIDIPWILVGALCTAVACSLAGETGLAFAFGYFVLGPIFGRAIK